MKSYCEKQKKDTEFVSNSERYEIDKNGRLMLKCTCAECGITKVKLAKVKKLNEPSLAGGSIINLYEVHSVGEALF